MRELTKRQKDILYAIITEFIETAQPVGSGLISDKYEIEASPATIRYEMVRLADEGFISKSHASSGRIPTVLGYRFYINDLMDEEDVHYLTELRLKKELSNLKFQRDKLIRGITSLLSDLTKYASVIVTEDGIFYSGLYNLLEYPEFEDRVIFKNILIAFDDLSSMMNIFNKNYTDNRVKVVIGEELDKDFFSDCSIIFTEINLYRGERGVLALIGPKRMNYAHVLPLLRLVADTIDRLTLGWEN
jgi:transcriptional regulator of heat shock response